MVFEGLCQWLRTSRKNDLRHPLRLTPSAPNPFTSSSFVPEHVPHTLPSFPTTAFATCNVKLPVLPLAPVTSTFIPFRNPATSLNCTAVHPLPPSPAALSNDTLAGFFTTAVAGKMAYSTSTPLYRVSRRYRLGSGLPKTASPSPTCVVEEPVATIRPEKSEAGIQGLLVKCGRMAIRAAKPWKMPTWVILTKTSFGRRLDGSGLGRSARRLRMLVGAPRVMNVQPRIVKGAMSWRVG